MKKVLLLILLSLFSTHLLSAQTSGPVQGICVQPTQLPLSSSSTGQLTSICNPDPTPTPTPIPTPTPDEGTIGPKYVIVTVTYAPPGSASNVVYSNSTLLGTSLSLSNSFTNDVNVSAQLSSHFSIFGFFKTNFTSTASADLTQETDTSSSVAVNETTTTRTTIRG